jgi:hypothetical protein
MFMPRGQKNRNRTRKWRRMDRYYAKWNLIAVNAAIHMKARTVLPKTNKIYSKIIIVNNNQN